MPCRKKLRTFFSLKCFYTFVDKVHPELYITAPKTALHCLTRVVNSLRNENLWRSSKG